MRKKIRTILFLSFLTLFLIMTPTLILYSQGYRFDLANKKITQTGGLFLKIWPKSVEVYLDNQPIKKTDFFFGSVLIENLLPKKYKIKITKDGFLPWEKTLEIKEKKVTEAKNIFLFPDNLSFEVLPKNEVDFWPSSETNEKISPDQKKLAYLSDSEIWLTFLEPQLEQPKKEAEEKVFLLRFSEKVATIFWLNNAYLIFCLKDKIKIAEIDDRDGINVYNIAEYKEPKIFWNNKDKKIYLLSENIFYSSENLF